MNRQSSYQMLDPDILPKNIAIIMDGNGRWAKAQGKPRVFGHKAGVDAVRKTVSAASRLGIKTLTLFAFSSENWRRPKDEVILLMNLFAIVLGREAKRLHKNNVRFKVIGDISRFSSSLQEKIAAAERLTVDNTGLTLNIAANYGGQWDILQAVQKIAKQVATGVRSAESLTEDDISAHLVTGDQPNIDLLIRTSGECRISNFMLWQAAYAEIYFTEQLWPDFDEQSLTNAIVWYSQRERRFGCTSEQLNALLQANKH